MSDKNIIEQLRDLRCSAPTQGAKIRQYLYETLPLDQVEAFEDHLGDCERCTKTTYLHEHMKSEEADVLALIEAPDDKYSDGRAIAASH
jgi:hypothetical protein